MAFVQRAAMVVCVCATWDSLSCKNSVPTPGEEEASWVSPAGWRSGPRVIVGTLKDGVSLVAFLVLFYLLAYKLIVPRKMSQRQGFACSGATDGRPDLPPLGK